MAEADFESTRSSRLPVNAYETPDAFVVLVPLPNIGLGDVLIERNESGLRISTSVSQSDARTYLSHEWGLGVAERVLDIPVSYGSEIEAEMSHGQLTVRVLAGAFTDPVSASLATIMEQNFDRRSRSGRRGSDLTVEQQMKVAESLVAFNDINSGLEGSRGFLPVLVDACAALLPDCSFAVILTAEGEQRCEFASTDAVRVLTEIQLEKEDSPARTALGQSAELLQIKLANDERWPEFTPLAAAAGFEMLYIACLQAEGRVLGALCIYDPQIRGAALLRTDLLTALTSGATTGIANTQSHRQANELADQLQIALNSRIIIEQAKGCVVARVGVDPNEAFALIRRYSRQNGMKIHDVAEQIVENKITSLQLRTAPPRGRA